MPPVVVEVSARELRFAAFRRERSGYALRELHVAPLAEGTFALGPLGGPVADSAALDAAIGALLARAGTRPRRISLVLPDAWARGMTVELDELPRSPELALEVLRFRMRKLVPYRIEELRIAAAPIERVAGQEETLRVLVLLAAEGVCAALERGFEARHVRLGQVTNGSLARLAALAHRGRLPGLAAVAAVEPEGFTLVFARDGAPVLWRQKSFTEGLGDDDRARLLGAELRLTRTFLAERLGGEELTAALLAAPRDVESFWKQVLESGLEHPVVALGEAHLPLESDPAAPPAVMATLVGAICRELAA